MLVELQRATHVAGVQLESRLADVGITQGEAHILALLADGADQTVGDLQRGLGHRPSTLSGILDRLELRGLIRRTVNGADRRSFLIGLTRRGRVAAGSVVAVLRSLERSALTTVSRRDLAGFLVVVRALEG